MFCEQCGHKNAGNAKFCARCGAPIHKPDRYAQPNTAPPDTKVINIIQVFKPKSLRESANLFFVLTAIIFALYFLFCIIPFGSIQHNVVIMKKLTGESLDTCQFGGIVGVIQMFFLNDEFLNDEFHGLANVFFVVYAIFMLFIIIEVILLATRKGIAAGEWGAVVSVIMFLFSILMIVIMAGAEIGLKEVDKKMHYFTLNQYVTVYFWLVVSIVGLIFSIMLRHYDFKASLQEIEEQEQSSKNTFNV